MPHLAPFDLTISLVVICISVIMVASHLSLSSSAIFHTEAKKTVIKGIKYKWE